MFAQHIKIDKEIKNIKPIANKQTISMFKLLETENKKLDTFSSLKVWIIAETNFNNNIKIIIFKIGKNMVEIKTTNPVAPTAFLTNILLAIIKLIPSDK